MVDRRSEMRTWQNKLYNLQREAPKPFPVTCTRLLCSVPEQYGVAYHGALSRQRTEEILDGQPSGAYLIRDCQSADGAYTLAIRFDDSTKNYKLFFDAVTKLHYVGEKKFDSVDLLVADGLIYLYIESRGADILQKLSEVSNYEHSPYYKTRYHTLNAVPPPPSAVHNFTFSSRRHMTSVAGGSMHRRLSSVNDLLDGHSQEIVVQPNASIPSSAEQVSNGDISDSSKISSAILSCSIEKPARSTSLPFPKPQRIQLSTDSSLSTSVKQAESANSCGSSVDTSLNSWQSSSSGSKNRRNVCGNGGNSSMQHHRGLASTMPVSLDGGLDASVVDANQTFQRVQGCDSTSLSATVESELVPLAMSRIDVEKAHSFRVHTFRGPHWCDYCTHFIWGLVSQGVKCTDCGFQAHKRCSISVPNDCLPDMKRLKRVFGVDLTSLVRAENRMVPQVLTKCITELERRGGLSTEGIYRVPGNHEIVEDFRIALDKDCESVDLSEKRCCDVSTISSLIKSFLRQLPIPLITYDAYPELIEISRDEHLSDEDKHDLTKACIQRLPPAHFHCLRYLMGHLNRVAANQHSNMMTSENLAIVFAPSLMSSSYTDPLSCLAGAKYEQAVVDRLVVEFTSIFDGEDAVSSANLYSSTSTTTSRSTTASSR